MTDNDAMAEHQTNLLQFIVNPCQYLLSGMMFLQKIAEIHDGSAVGHILTNIGKLAKWQNIMQVIFSRTIAEVKPELQAMDTEHEHQRERSASSPG